MTYAYKLNNVKFCYHKIMALSLSELSIQSGKITALIGPNGSGKSTLLNLLAFLCQNQQGCLYFFHELVTRQKIPLFIRRVAFVSQNPYLLRGTVVFNLNLALKFHNLPKNQRLIKVNSILEKLNITHIGQQQTKTLSAGERQKVALARAIITNPQVLLLDEPFSYLDYNSENLIEQFIQNFIKEADKTVIFSTHNNLQGLVVADNAISLVKGNVVYSPLVNLYHGTSHAQVFNTGKIQIILAKSNKNYQHISIDPHKIVLSKEPLISSMRNQYLGKVIEVADKIDNIRVSILAGELFHILVTQQAFNELEISLGKKLWVNFKANSILAF